MPEDRSDLERLEAAAADYANQRFVLRLYVAGMTPASQRAIANIAQICDDELRGRYELDVIDVYQRPQLAADEQVVAAPTLVKLLPEPVARVVGDLSDTSQVLVGLDLRLRDR